MLSRPMKDELLNCYFSPLFSCMCDLGLHLTFTSWGHASCCPHPQAAQHSNPCPGKLTSLTAGWAPLPSGLSLGVVSGIPGRSEDRQ